MWALCSIDAKPESSVPALPHMRIPDVVPTNTSRCASQRKQEDWMHWLKLCGVATPWVSSIGKITVANAQESPLPVIPTSTLPAPPSKKPPKRRFWLATTTPPHPVGLTVVPASASLGFRCESLRAKTVMCALWRGCSYLERRYLLPQWTRNWDQIGGRGRRPAFLFPAPPLNPQFDSFVLPPGYSYRSWDPSSIDIRACTERCHPRVLR